MSEDAKYWMGLFQSLAIVNGHLEDRINKLEADKKYMAARIKTAKHYLDEALSARGLNDVSSFSNYNPDKFPKSVGVRGEEFNGR